MILFRYIFKESSKNFILSFLIINSLLLLTRFISILIRLTSEQLFWQDYLQILFYLAPGFASISLPLAALVAILFTFMRLSQDRELLALESLGISFLRLLKPVFAFSIILLILAFYMNLSLVPWSKRSIENFLFKVTQKKLSRGFPEKTFIRWIPSLTLFIEKTSNNKKKLFSIFILDESNPQKETLIFASHGKWETKAKKFKLILENGFIHSINKKQQILEKISFKEYIYNLSLNSWHKNRSLHWEEMPFMTLWEKTKNLQTNSKKQNRYSIELWRRLSLPWAVMISSFLGAPLGAMIRASGKGVGLFWAIILSIFYYILFSISFNLALKGILPLPLVFNLPNLFFTIVGIFLIYLVYQGKIKKIE